MAWHPAFAALQKLDCKVTRVMLVSSYLSCKTHVSPDKKIIGKWPVRIGQISVQRRCLLLLGGFFFDSIAVMLMLASKL